jgi:glycosyltransferase involved in cell wall biosynthesis
VTDRTRVSIISGLCVRNDAISNAVLDQADTLERHGYEVKVFAHHADVDRRPVTTVGDPWILQRDDHFLRSDLLIFHFGIYYSLFNAVLVAPARSEIVVHFHNVTPPGLLDGWSRSQVMRGLDQLTIAERANSVWCVSAHNAEVLLSETDVDPARVRVVGLLVPWADEVGSPAEPCHPESATRLLSVGRIVAAKGVVDLVRAFAGIPDDRVTLDLVANSAQSDGRYVREVERLIAELGLECRIRVRFDVDDDELRCLYRDTDVYVSASHHEGLCVPVIEALAAGRRVVATDAGALPDTVNGFGTIVGVGDVAALSAAITAEVRRGADAGAGILTDELVEHVRTFGPVAYERRLLHEVADVLERSDRPSARTRGEVRPAPAAVGQD